MLDLASFQIDPLRGFLPAADPLQQLPAPFALWEQLAADAPTLAQQDKVRPLLESLPPLDISPLTDSRQLERAMLLLSIMGCAYVFAGPEPADTLPAGIAIPWHQIATKLDRPPIATYASLVLHNWRLIDPNRPLELDNIATLNTFTGTRDEEWFYLVTVAIEQVGAPAVNAIVRAQTAVHNNDTAELTHCLQTIGRAIEEMQAVMARMVEQCAPYVFYHQVRPFLNGWYNPHVIYTGVSPTPQHFVGGSAAQSSLLQSLDAALGVTHTDKRSGPFLKEMRLYMPPPHRRFVEAIEQGPSIRRLVIAQTTEQPAAAEAYNRCILALDTFRRMHREMALAYIADQSPDPTHEKGTGGTHFVRLLSKTERDTRKRLLQPAHGE